MLSQLGIRTVLDLRSEEEADRDHGDRLLLLFTTDGKLRSDGTAITEAPVSRAESQLIRQVSLLQMLA